MNQRFFIRKKEAFRLEEQEYLETLNSLSGVDLDSVEVYQVYDVFDIDETEREVLLESVLCDKLVDEAVDESDLADKMTGTRYLGMAFLEGQYDQRADAAEQCLELMVPATDAKIRSAKLLIFDREVGDEALDRIRDFLINPVEACEKDFSVLSYNEDTEPDPLPTFTDFNDLDDAGLERLLREQGMAMSLDDLRMIQDYFKDEERTPTAVELKVLDTYWSDHCRHTTFNTALTDIDNRSERFKEKFDSLLARYDELRKANGREDRDRCLMELATIIGRDLRRRGLLDRQEVSDEINACSVRVTIDNNGEEEPWLLMFKNETHNHPTEIEPFGGASTCLGGAIRDPLSGRAYVYQALRLSGAADINTSLEDTLPNKLPQREISRKACDGYSSYGNQIGLATTAVREFFHPGYVAKRLELGAVVAAVPEDQLVRKEPRPGDVVVILGGRTGRDGVGGATGSSKAHDSQSLRRSGSEVQKGNPVTERKIQRLFRRPEIGRMIRKCNDFGAGGVAVAVGELADGLDIDLNKVPLKYRGLNAMEIAISESQERMAVVLAPEDADRFVATAAEENLEAVVLATVNDENHLRMHYNGDTVLDLSREFLDLNGAPRAMTAVLTDDAHKQGLLPLPKSHADKIDNPTKEDILKHLAAHNHGMQEGMVEQFDASIGRSTVLMPYGGKYQKSEENVSAQTFPTADGSRTASVMTYGYSPKLAEESPYLMGAYSVVEALSRLTAAGVDYRESFLTCQEYFRRLEGPETWGIVIEALLGLMEAQDAFSVAAIGGKDSMSGSFNEINVPPTLVTFAIGTNDRDKIISATLPKADLNLYYLPHETQTDGSPDYALLRKQFETYCEWAEAGKIAAGSPVRAGGISETVIKMALGNRVGFNLDLCDETLFEAPLGGIVFASSEAADSFGDSIITLGKTFAAKETFTFGDAIELTAEEAESTLQSAYAHIYPLRNNNAESLPEFAMKLTEDKSREAVTDGPETQGKILNADTWDEAEGRIRVLLPVFPGGNSEYDTAAAFRAAGADTLIHLIRNLDQEMAEQDRRSFIKKLNDADILVFSGGFSFGDEPDGSAKFIVNFLKNADVCEAVEDFLDRDGLMLGICNGFQALLKSGFLPYGHPAEQHEDSPTLFNNVQNRHVSAMANCRVTSRKSPWLAGFEAGHVHTIPVSHGEGRVMIAEAEAKRLFANGQIAFQYVDATGEPTMASPHNPNGSDYAIEGMISPDGRILGKMGHSERCTPDLMRNIPGDKNQNIFANAVNYVYRQRKSSQE